MRHVSIAEHGIVCRLELASGERDALLSCGAGLSLSPEQGPAALWSLRAGCRVGAVVLPGVTVRIRPKLAVSRLFAMLSASTGSIQWDEARVGMAESDTVEDVVAKSLLDAIDRGLAGGLLRGYEQVEEEAFVVRGRLDLAQTIRRRPVLFAPLTQSSSVLSEDTHENRVLAAALGRLRECVASTAIRSRIVGVQRAFSGVSGLPAAGASIPRMGRNRLNARWWGAVELAVLVLRSCGLDLPDGKAGCQAFLVDMNAVFERFVHGALAEALGPRGVKLEHNRGGIDLDEGGQHALRPDLSLWRGGRCEFVGECKYKFSSGAQAGRDDLFQALAYAAATGVRSVTLYYAGESDDARDLRVVRGGPVVRVRTIDLSAPAGQLRARFTALAKEVRAPADVRGG